MRSAGRALIGGVCAAFLLASAAAPAAWAAPATSGGLGALSEPSSAAALQFTPVRTLDAEPTSLVALDTDTAVVATSVPYSDTRVISEGGPGGWISTTLPSTSSLVHLARGGDGEVWAYAGYTLFRRTGPANWQQVTLPELPGSPAITSLFDPPGADAYVNVATSTTNTTTPGSRTDLWKFDGATWQNLGGTLAPGSYSSRYESTRMREFNVVDGQLTALVERSASPGYTDYRLFTPAAPAWTPTATVATAPLGTGQIWVNGWLPWSAGNQVFLGINRGTDYNTSPLCFQVIGPDRTRPCTTAGPVSTVVRHGDLALIGGERPRVDGQYSGAPATFRARTSDGSEWQIPGDAGDRTVALDVDPAGASAWAITQTGSGYTLQRLGG